ncbi:MAG: ABC transporter substrate-binding protein [Phycisphaerae bacterium]|nr:ABC transporter substrate-binding protein [Phycisphaerae bacterium]
MFRLVGQSDPAGGLPGNKRKSPDVIEFGGQVTSFFAGVLQTADLAESAGFCATSPYGCTMMDVVRRLAGMIVGLTSRAPGLGSSAGAAALLVLGLQFAGCDRPSEGRSDSSEFDTTGRPRTVPTRIVAIAPNATEMIFALGAGESLVGVSDFCRLPAREESSGRTEPARVGGLIDPNLELILRLEPDLVVLRGRIDPVESLCRAHGISVYHDPTNSFDDVFRTIGELGDMLGREREAAALMERTRLRIERVRQTVAGRPVPRVLFTTDRPVDSLSRVTTCGKGTFVDEMIRRAGGENIFGSLEVAYPEVSLEAVLLARPEVIVEVMPVLSGDHEALARRVTEQWRRLGSLPAAENGRIHVLTDAELVIPSPRIADAIERLAGLLHPEVSFE